MNIRFFALSIAFLTIISLQAQQRSGTIKYKQTTYIDTEKIPANMQMDMPKSFDAFMRLSFNKTISLYEKDPDYKEEINPNDNTPRMFRRMRERSNKVIYKNITESTSIEQSNLFGKDFLVSDSIAAIKWKVSAGEQKTILGYTCMKATFKDSTNNLVVFFTPQMPVGFGPDKYGNLPGIILEVQSAQIHIIATEVKKDEPIIQPPTKGDKVTRKEFDKIREEKMKEQREMWGGQRGGDVRVIRQ
jgi:GLPGLI family protein